MTHNFDRRSEAYMFWCASRDYYRDLRNGVPIDQETVLDDFEVMRDMTEWPALSDRCGFIIGSLKRLPMGRLA